VVSFGVRGPGVDSGMRRDGRLVSTPGGESRRGAGTVRATAIIPERVKEKRKVAGVDSGCKPAAKGRIYLISNRCSDVFGRLVLY
jgi:hypothetical protein